jgi:hypothetical protein
MTKILHFNISGNHLFENEKPRIIIKDLGRCMANETEEEELKNEGYFYEHYTTLRDISVLLREACGQGVMWNFSREMAAELNLDKKDVEIALENIVRKYAEMSEEEARKKYDELACYIKTYNGGPEETE